MPFTQLRDFHLYLHTPTPIFKARVNMASVTYPVTALTFDGVTLGAFGNLAADMTLILGTTDGADDLGRVRVQNVATSTTIPVGRISQGTEDGTLNVTDNAYITVWDDWRVWAKLPYSSPAGIDYKDSTVEVGTYNEEPPPVAVMGAGFADYIDDITGLITVTFDGTDSYAVADGATITGYAWTIEDGTVTAGDVDEDTVTVTFPAGFRYVALTVTDSNGLPHSTRRPVLAVDPDADPTIKFQVPNHRIEMRGQTIGFELFDNTPRTTFPDGGLVMFWADAPVDPTDRRHMWFIGYHQSDSFNIRATPTGLIRTTVLNCVDVAGRLAALPGFPQALERNASEAQWYNMPTLDMRKCLHYLAFWHSTALSVADFILPDSLSDYPAMRLDSTGASLYDQINSRAQSCVPDHWLTCNIQGQLLVKPDWMLLDFDDRPADTAGTLTEDFWNDIRVDYTRPPRVYALNSSAVVCSTDWLMIGGEETLPLAFCIAPGSAFGQGVSESVTGEKLTISQAALNACEGHRYARLNARYGLFTIVEPTGDIQDFQPAHMLPVQVNISAATAAQRGLDFTTARGLVRSIDMRYNHTEHGTWVSPTLQWEREVVGLPAVTHIPDEAEDPDYEVPEPPPATVPPDFGLIDGQDLVAGIGLDGYVYRTSDFQTPSGSGGPTWTRVDTTIADTIYSFVVDPFSPGYINGTGAINGWIVNDTDIYRVTDLFGSVVATSVFTFDEPTVAASFHWRSIQASFGAFFAEGANPWLLCVSYYGDTVGHTGTWVTRSTDGGVTWSAEVQITAHYNTDTPTRFMPIGVYCSPKTPGLAYTVAFSETAAAAEAQGYKSQDWGATWAAYTDIQTGQGMGGAIHSPWPDNAYEELLYHGKLTTESVPGTAEELMPYLGVFLQHQGVSDEDNVWEPLGYKVSHTLIVQAEEVGTTAGIEEDEGNIIIAPPPDTVRMVVEVTWDASQEVIGLSSDADQSMSLGQTSSGGSSVTRTGTINYVAPPENGGTSGGGTITWTLATGTDWPYNSETIQVSPPTTSAVGCRVRAYTIANAVGESALARSTNTFTVTVTEIELDDGTIYTPVEASGSRSFKTMRVSGGIISDISPTDVDRSYGVNSGHFGVRSYDSDRQLMAVAGIGNDATTDPADDEIGLWVSNTAGATWTNILAPAAAANAPRGLQIAFGGDNGDILFAWGGVSDGSLAAIYYSDDFGVSLDSREGNINSLGTATIIGIAGGPTS